MARTIVFATAALALAAAAGPTRSQEGTAPPPAVVVAPATMVELAQSVTVTGRLEADARVELRARVSGFLEEVTFEPGDVVEAGTVLYRIERGPYEAAVQEAEGAVEAANAARDLAELERDRQAELVAREASPQAVLDQAEAALGQASGDLTRLEGTLAQAQLNLGYTEIEAPFTGRIGVSEFDVGALVGPDTGALVTLIQLDPIHAEASITTASWRNYQESVAAGATGTAGDASLILANGSTYSERGSVDFVDSQVNAGTDSVTFRARFANPTGLLLDDELVNVVLTQAEPEPVLAIPLTAVQRDVQGAFAMVVDASGTVDQRRIDVARTDTEVAVIADGLEEGEQVITEGVNKVRAGITVDAAPASEG